MEEEELITLDKKCLMVDDENGEERRAFVDEQVDYEKWEEEVLSEMGFDGFLKLKKASFGNHLMDKFNRLMHKRYHEKYGWKKTRMYIEVTKRTQLKGKDMRKKLNEKVVDEYKNSIDRKNKRRLEEFRKKIYESKVNKGREEKLIAQRFIPYEDEFSEILTADHMYKESNNTKCTRRRLYNTPPIDMEWFRSMLDKDFPAPKEVIVAMDEELDLLFDTRVFEIKDFDEIAV